MKSIMVQLMEQHLSAV